jgi:hypothetical protein
MIKRQSRMSRSAQKTVRFALALAIVSHISGSAARQATAQSESTAGKSHAVDGSAPTVCKSGAVDSLYIPVDSWVYPAVMRLYALGYASNVYLGMRPWTLMSVRRMIDDTKTEISDAESYGDSTAEEAQGLYAALTRELNRNASVVCPHINGQLTIQSYYSAVRAISGTPLHDSFHLGSTINNDYGRPLENGVSNYSGLSGYLTAGRFLLYARGEFQSAPSANGYSEALAKTLSGIDIIPFIDPATGLPYKQETIPMGPIPAITRGRFLEAYVSTRVLNHEVSFGKQDEWLGPAVGAGMAYSNNAENIYTFKINRILPLEIPLLSRLTGPFRYEFLIGKLRGHTYMPNPAYIADPAPGIPNVMNPGNPWVHIEKFSFRPTRDLEVGFERTVIWGGKGHEPITLHSFLKSFFSTQPTYPAIKFSSNDPGARFSAFDFTYRLPFPRNWLVLYTDSEAHDAPSPIAKPLHGAFRPGLYLSHFPGVSKLDLRAEAVNTDSSHPGSLGGHYQYWEAVQVQGYTNNGQLFGDWAGRESKGGQAWLTYHFSGNEWAQLGVRRQKASKDFIPGGTTLSDVTLEVVKRLKPDLELRGNFTFERYKAPIYLPGTQTVTATTFQLTWFPERKVNF